MEYSRKVLYGAFFISAMLATSGILVIMEGRQYPLAIFNITAGISLFLCAIKYRNSRRFGAILISIVGVICLLGCLANIQEFFQGGETALLFTIIVLGVISAVCFSKARQLWRSHGTAVDIPIQPADTGADIPSNEWKAIEDCDDEDRLIEYATLNENPDIRLAAFGKLTDNSLYPELVEKEINRIKGRLQVGMTLSEVKKVLGTPTSSMGGDQVVSMTQNAGVNVPPSIGGLMGGKTFAEWDRPEGRYKLVLENGKLSNIYSVPESYTEEEVEQIQNKPEKNIRGICAGCDRTSNEIMADFDSMRARGVQIIGSGDGLLYCDNCDKEFCGRCQVDLGFNSGCPRCKQALD